MRRILKAYQRVKYSYICFIEFFYYLLYKSNRLWGHKQATCLWTDAEVATTVSSARQYEASAV